jgi:hypothetical protein
MLSPTALKNLKYTEFKKKHCMKVYTVGGGKGYTFTSTLILKLGGNM